jgi:hypothetical protein
MLRRRATIRSGRSGASAFGVEEDREEDEGERARDRRVRRPREVDAAEAEAVLRRDAARVRDEREPDESAWRSDAQVPRRRRLGRSLVGVPWIPPEPDVLRV